MASVRHESEEQTASSGQAPLRVATAGLDPDVVVIGGGVNGTGVARDCALRGLRVVLLERHDLGYGASGNSSGFIHGGPRYLLSDPSVTRSSCVDSGHIQRIAPHLVFRVPVLLPIPTAWGRASLFLHDAFFRAYDRFQPLKGGKPHGRLSAKELETLEPGLVGDYAGAVTFDEWGIDGVRLCVANALDAKEHGAKILTHTTVTEIQRGPSGAVEGVLARDRITGESHRFRASLVVNATGAWGPITSCLAGLPPSVAQVRPGKGIHVYYGRRLSNYAIVTRAIDGRQVFVLPWQNTTVIGTTDDDYYGDLDHVEATFDEVQYLVQAVARVFPTILDARAIGTWAGIRPTLFSWGPTEDALSRDHRLVDHAQHGAPGLLSLIGGKLASYRLFAEEATDHLMTALGREGHSLTARCPLPGGGAPADVEALAEKGSIHAIVASRLAYRYGDRAASIVEKMVDAPGEAIVVCACEPVTTAEIRHAVREEGARTVADVARRTRLGLGACGGMRCAARCGALVADLTGQTARDGLAQARSFLAEAARRRLPALGPEQARQEVLLQASVRASLGQEPE